MHRPEHGAFTTGYRPGAGIPAQVAASAMLGLLAMQALRLAGLGGTASAWLVVSLLYAIITALIGRQMSRTYPHARIGGGNTVTLLRVAMTCGLLAPLLAGHAAGWAVALAGGLALGLDGVDGWLARRSRLTSAFGARFDMEVDAAFALTLALHLWLGGFPGPEVLLLGMLRYLFVAAGVGLPWLRAALPVSFRRKLICVLQLAVLIVLQTPLLAPAAAVVLAWLAIAAVAWSFAIDIRWLWTHRA